MNLQKYKLVKSNDNSTCNKCAIFIYNKEFNKKRCLAKETGDLFVFPCVSYAPLHSPFYYFIKKMYINILIRIL